jgi:hypothetical protein
MASLVGAGRPNTLQDGLSSLWTHLVSLLYLHMASILDELQLHYARKASFRYISEIRVSANSIEKLPAVSTRPHMERYAPELVVNPVAGNDKLGATGSHSSASSTRCERMCCATGPTSRSNQQQEWGRQTVAKKIVTMCFALTFSQSSSPSSIASASTKFTRSIETQLLQSSHSSSCRQRSHGAQPEQQPLRQVNWTSDRPALLRFQLVSSVNPDQQ